MFEEVPVVECSGTCGGVSSGPVGAGWCCSRQRRARASPLTCLAVCCLLLGYNLMGAFLFLALERSSSDETAVAASKPNLSQAGVHRLTVMTVDRLWAITEDLNILYKENWTRLAAKELMDFQKVLVGRVGGAEARLASGRVEEYRWTFSSSFLYALTLITTIGQSGPSPVSPMGRLAAIVYGCFGIPVVMMFLSTLGQALTLSFRRLYGRLRGTAAGRLHSALEHSDRRIDRQTPFQTALNLGTLSPRPCRCCDYPRVPLSLSVVPMLLYVALGTVVFHTTEKWSILDGCYFSFCSLATIGFGDLTPGLHARTTSATAEDIALGVCALYILVGMVVVAMCFNLIREEIQWTLRGRCAGGLKTHAMDTGGVGAS